MRATRCRGRNAAPSATPPVLRLSALCLAVLAAAPAAGAQPGACPTTTGEDATVVIPEGVLAPGTGLEAGDPVRAYGDGGRCAGEAVWPADGGLSLTLWGDDRATPEPEGIAAGEGFTLYAVRGDALVELEVALASVRGAPPETGTEYHPDAIYVVSLIAAPGVAVALAPESPPVVISDKGGNFRYSFTVTNGTAQPQTVQAWTRATRPDGTETHTLVGPVTVVLGPGASVTRRITQWVNSGAPAGEYRYTGYVGSHPDGAVAASGFTGTKESGQQGPSGSGEAWLALYTESRMLVTTRDVWTASASAPPVDLPEPPSAFALRPARPNPFASRTTLEYDLPEDAHVRLTVYDVLGRAVAVLVDGEVPAQRHEVVLDGARLPSGTYFVRMTAGGFAQTRRLTRVR